jgi:hypothetical protein
MSAWLPFREARRLPPGFLHERVCVAVGGKPCSSVTAAAAPLPYRSPSPVCSRAVLSLRLGLAGGWRLQRSLRLVLPRLAQGEVVGGGSGGLLTCRGTAG